MSIVRTEEEVKNFKLILDKLIESSSLEHEEERIVDVLKSLSKICMNVDLLRTTDIGSSLKEIRKAFSDKSIGTLTKQLIVKWKKDCSLASDGRSDATEKRNCSEVKMIASENICSSSKNTKIDESNEEWDDEHYSHLSIPRRKIMDLIADALKLNCPEVIAKLVAYSVEAAINNIFSAEKDSKNYLVKAKSLTFNFKNNEKLRVDVIGGSISPEKLVTLSTKELATDEIKSAREETTKTATLARRGDIYELARAEIAKANDIDPNKGGEFVCSRCKGTKTSHYAMQTRSSDEPMTIFVCCLTCSKRWRC